MAPSCVQSACRRASRSLIGAWRSASRRAVRARFRSPMSCEGASDMPASLAAGSPSYSSPKSCRKARRVRSSRRCWRPAARPAASSMLSDSSIAPATKPAVIGLASARAPGSSRALSSAAVRRSTWRWWTSPGLAARRPHLEQQRPRQQRLLGDEAQQLGEAGAEALAPARRLAAGRRAAARRGASAAPS